MPSSPTPAKQDEIHDAWIARMVVRAAAASGLHEVVRELVELLVDAGLQPGRVNLAVLTVHPALAGRGWAWTRASRGVLCHERPAGFLDTREHRESPLHAVMTTRETLRLKLHAGEGLDRFDIVSTFVQAGATDYLAVPITSPRGDVHVLAAWTDRTGGWTEAQVDLVRALVPVVSMSIDRFEGHRLAEMIATTYLGRRTGLRVLDGQIHRGTNEHIRAAVWFSDVRSFTDLTRRYGDDAIVRALDGWLEMAVGAVDAHRGEVLKFMGDALLAIFPVEGDDWKSAVDNALDAAAELQEGERRRAHDTKMPMTSGVALHTGEVIYGNIGAPTRLDFTVIGSAVNITARIAGLCRTLAEPVLVSRRLAESTDRRFRICGTHALRGIDTPMDVLAPYRD